MPIPAFFDNNNGLWLITAVRPTWAASCQFCVMWMAGDALMDDETINHVQVHHIFF